VSTEEAAGEEDCVRWIALPPPGRKSRCMEPFSKFGREPRRWGKPWRRGGGGWSPEETRWIGQAASTCARPAMEAARIPGAGAPTGDARRVNPPWSMEPRWRRGEVCSCAAARCRSTGDVTRGRERVEKGVRFRYGVRSMRPSTHVVLVPSAKDTVREIGGGVPAPGMSPLATRPWLALLPSREIVWLALLPSRDNAWLTLLASIEEARRTGLMLWAADDGERTCVGEDVGEDEVLSNDCPGRVPRARSTATRAT